MLSTKHRLTSSRDFQKIYARGRQLKGQYGKMVILSRGDDKAFRFGISVSTKVGNATVRNKIKRRVREIVRSQISNIGSGCDIVYVVWSSKCDFNELAKDLSSLLISAVRRG